MKQLAAVIIETRPSVYLISCIDKHLKKLPLGTDLFILTCDENKYVNDHFSNSYTTLIDKIDIPGYNALLTNTNFWRMFIDKYEKVLVFQTDTMLLQKGIQSFYGWDYVGAPWAWNPHYAGNGGLSLRNPAVMVEVLTRFPWNGKINEDHWITMHMFDHKIGKLAPIDVAKRFSCEAIFALGTLGYHAIEEWLPAKQVEHIKKQYEHQNKMEITLTDLNVNVEYHYQKPVFGGSYADTGDQEILPAEVDIYSVKCKGIELISLLESDQLAEMNEQILEKIKAQDA